MNRRHCLAAAALALLATSPARAQPDYPAKPITMVVGYPPGGSTDLVARIMAAELGKRLGQAVVIDNSGGAGGAIGAQKVAAAAPDGYTLLMGTNNEMAISRLVNPALRYEAQRDFTPVGLIASQPMVLVAAPHTKVKNAEEFLALVKKSPGKYNYGTSGNGTALHLAGEMAKQSAGVFLVHIPYRGVAPLTNDLLGGQLDFGVLVLSSGLPHIRSGKVVALGTTEARRSPAAPDIPSLSEHPLLRNMNIGVWFGLFGPARLPDAVTQRLRTAYIETMNTPEVRKKLEEAGARPVTLAAEPPEKLLAAYLRVETEKYGRVVDFAKIRE
jgi:tripartite-type tricarboxylate transporter receptor subunit TctC